jgi:hypothetical protein
VPPVRRSRRTPRRTGGVGDIVAPIGVDQFLASYWTRAPHQGRLSETRLEWLRAQYLGLDPEALIDRHSDRIEAWIQTLDGEAKTMPVQASQAVNLYRAGVTLYLHKATTPAISAWHRRIARDLGAFEGSLTCSLFLARRGGGTPYHFDCLENLTVQLSGTKRWRLAANQDVAYPIQNWMLAHPIPNEMRLYASTVPRLGKPIRRTALRPGDTLYVPRGYWHAIDADEDSVSLFVGFGSNTWADLVTGALRSLLVRNDRWRRRVIDPRAGSGWSQQARRELDGLLDDLGEEVGRLSSDVLLAGGHALRKTRRASTATKWTRNPLATLAIPTANGDGDVTVTLHYGLCKRELILAMDRRHWPMCRWLADRSPISTKDLLARFPAHRAEQVRNLVDQLCDSGFLLRDEAQLAQRTRK